MLITHIASGSICLGAGLFALFARKGKRAHTASGLWFYYSMLLTIFSAFYLSIVTRSLFLFSIAIFSLFFVLSGRRYLKIIKGKKVFPKKQDWALTSSALISAILLIFLSVFQILKGDSTAAVSISFAVLGLVFAIQDIQIYRGKWTPPVFRLRMHLSRMLAAYITTITAFFVAGMKMWNVFAWLGPTLVGTFVILYYIKRLKAKKLAFVLFLGLVANIGLSQDIDNELTRYKFAKTYYGVDFNFTPSFSDGLALDESGALTNFQRNAFLTPALNLGATHFWGHTDFYISINTANLKFQEDEYKNRASYRVFTGLRVYPFKTKINTLRPYVGYKFSALTYTQENLEGQSASTSKTRSTLDVGLTYQTKKFYTYLGYNFIPRNELDFYVSQSEKVSTQMPSQFLTLGINYIFDTTLGNQNCRECKHFNEVFGASNADGWYFAIGPSSAFPIQSSSYISTYAPFLNQFVMPRLFPEISLGYHFTKLDFLLNASYRSITQTREAYNYIQKFSRRSLVLEGAKILGDYHGFVPYLGVGASLESLALNEENNGETISDVSKMQITPSFIFGWDIRPSRKGDSWVLRTNVRYAPWLRLQHRDQFISAQQIEFNFIQFVYYPQRAKAYRNWKG